MKILLLEDSVIVAKLLASLLKSRGYEVIEAVSVAQAMDHLVEADIAILDYQLPDGNGLDVARELRRRKPSAYLILLTARGHSITEREARRAGIDQYLEKPVEPETILGIVEVHSKQAAA